MSPADPSGAPTRLADSLALALLVVALVLPWLGATELTSTDEARYTQVAREMRLAGRWFSPLLNGEEYWEKPALFFDILQVPQLLSGRATPIGSRLMILPFAIAAVLATYAAGRILAGRRAGLLAGAILATSALFAELAGSAVLDMPMLAFIALALAAHVAATRGDSGCVSRGLAPQTPLVRGEAASDSPRRGGPSQSSVLGGLAPQVPPGHGDAADDSPRRPRLRLGLAAAIAMGLGCLFKGPVAILLPGVVMAADAISRRGRSAWRTPRLLWMPLVALLVLGLWVVPMAFIHGHEFVDHALGKHVVDRSVGAAAPHAKGALFYLPRLLLAWFPWSLALPAAIAGWRRAGPPLPGRPDPRDALRFARIWALGIPLLLALLASKRSQYLLPAAPGFALWIAIWLDSRMRAGSAFAPGELRALRGAGIALSGLAPVVAVSIPLLLGLSDFRATWAMLGAGLPSAFWLAAEGSVLISIGAGAALLLGIGGVALARPAPQRVLLGLLALGIGTTILRQGIADPHIDRSLRANEFGAELSHYLAADGCVATYGLRLNGTYLLHSGATRFETLDTAEDVAAHLDAAGARAVLGKHRYLRRYVLPELHGAPPVVLLRHGEGRGEVVLLGNRAAGALGGAGTLAPQE